MKNSCNHKSMMIISNSYATNQLRSPCKNLLYRSKKGSNCRKYLSTLIICLLLFSLSSCVFRANTNSTKQKETLSSHITTIMEGKLKNPESFQLHSVLVKHEFEYNGYRYYSVSIDYSAQNGFGGYNRDNDYGIYLKVDNISDKAKEIYYTEYSDAWKGFKNSH